MERHKRTEKNEGGSGKRAEEEEDNGWRPKGCRIRERLEIGQTTEDWSRVDPGEGPLRMLVP